jgi:hypothetical protein
LFACLLAQVNATARYFVAKNALRHREDIEPMSNFRRVRYLRKQSAGSGRTAMQGKIISLRRFTAVNYRQAIALDMGDASRYSMTIARAHKRAIPDSLSAD